MEGEIQRWDFVELGGTKSATVTMQMCEMLEPNAEIWICTGRHPNSTYSDKQVRPY